MIPIGPEYRSAAILALIGPNHSNEIPANLWIGWIDGDGEVVAMSGMLAPRSTWEEDGEGGVTNTAELDCGSAAEDMSSVVELGLFDAEEDGDLVYKFAVTFATALEEGDPIVAPVESLTSSWSEPA